jgi:hypothetical protein
MKLQKKNEIQGEFSKKIIDTYDGFPFFWIEQNLARSLNADIY